MDVDFVRRAVKAIGQTAVKIESAAPRCVELLLDLIQTRVSYVVQEAVVVLRVSSALASDRDGTDLALAGRLPKIPAYLRGRDSNAMRKPGRARRARSKSISHLDYWRIRGKD